MSEADPNKQSLRATRRTFIKGAIASGVAISAVGYVVYERAGRRPPGGAVERLSVQALSSVELRDTTSKTVDTARFFSHCVVFKLCKLGARVA